MGVNDGDMQASHSPRWSMVRDSAQVGYHSIGRRGQEEGAVMIHLGGALQSMMVHAIIMVRMLRVRRMTVFFGWGAVCAATRRRAWGTG